MNEEDLLNQHVDNRTQADEFIQPAKRFWLGSRRRTIQLLAASAGAAAILLPTFSQKNVAVAAKAEAKDMNKQANKQVEPNLFELQGYDTQIVYSTSSIQGVPQLTYSSQEQERAFSGSEIQSEETKLGPSVTVILENGAADKPIEGLTLLLPLVQLATKKELPILTLAILSRRAVFVNPNAPLQLQNYDTISLFGTAKIVQF